MNKFFLGKTLESLTKSENILLISIAVLSTVLMVFVGYKLLQMLQLTGYKLKGYFSWFKETKYSYFSRLFMLTFLSVASMLMTNVLLEDFFIIKTMRFVSILFFFLFSSLFITNLFTAKQKTPLKYTKRMMRFVVVYSILILIFTLFIVYLGYLLIPYLSFSLIGIIPILLPLIVLISYFITYPVEKIISNTYIKKAKKKIGTMKNLKVIGITGSYGKTTIKNILTTLLEKKFKVCATPASYNTPLGLAKTILSKLESNDEIFIAEMGARQKNDIMELCTMVSPKIGIITGIGNQHLLTFGSEDNIIETKGELADFVTKNSGELYICTESKNAKTLSEKYEKSCKIQLNSEKNLQFENIVVTKSGSEFDIVSEEKRYHTNTILLGSHSISNIYLASVVAMNLGVDVESICDGIKQLVSIPHRLEIISSNSTYTIIDDSYNSSVEGCKASIEVLSKFDTGKFVITPGLVELGKKQAEANAEFGKNLASVCDYVIIDSLINYDAIYSGLVSNGFDEKKIIKAVNLKQAVEFLNQYAKQSDVVLFENDLPDNYN